MGAMASVLPTSDSRVHRVKLAVTPLGPLGSALPLIYHTSVSVDGLEFSFSKSGIVCCPDYRSHRSLPGFTAGSPWSLIDLGYSARSGTEMVSALSSYFKEGTYDLLRKNCNTFTAAALFFLLGTHLDSKYRAVDAIGASADQLIGLVQLISFGDYMPNPKSADFDLNHVFNGLQRGLTSQPWSFGGA